MGVVDGYPNESSTMLVLLIVKTSRLDQYRDVAAKSGVCLDSDDPITTGWQQAHDEHTDCLKVVRQCLDTSPNVVVRTLGVVDIGKGLAEDFTVPDLVVVVGGDGTFLTASHFIGANTPILGVNSAPSSSTGFFCAADSQTFGGMLKQHLEEGLPSIAVNRMEVAVGARVVSRRVLNDALFCNLHPAATSRLVISCHGLDDVQNSSGVWVGTAAGSTGATRSAGGSVLPLTSRNLQLVVREPINGHTRHLIVQPGTDLIVRSRMDTAAVYIDGPYTEAWVRLGDAVSFKEGEPLTVLGLNPQRHR